MSLLESSSFNRLFRCSKYNETSIRELNEAMSKVPPFCAVCVMLRNADVSRELIADPICSHTYSLLTFPRLVQFVVQEDIPRSSQVRVLQECFTQAASEARPVPFPATMTSRGDDVILTCAKCLLRVHASASLAKLFLKLKVIIDQLHFVLRQAVTELRLKPASPGFVTHARKTRNTLANEFSFKSLTCCLHAVNFAICFRTASCACCVVARSRRLQRTSTCTSRALLQFPNVHLRAHCVEATCRSSACSEGDSNRSCSRYYTLKKLHVL